MNELELTRGFDPHASGGEDAAVTQGRAELLALIADREQAVGAGVSGGSRQRRPAWRRRGGLALAGGLLAAFVAIALSLNGNEAGVGTPPAKAALIRVAEQIEAGGDEQPLGEGDFYYTATKNYVMDSFLKPQWGAPRSGSAKHDSRVPWQQIERVSEQSWLAHDGRLRMTMNPRSIPIDFPTRADRLLWKRAGGPKQVEGISMPAVSFKKNARPFTVGRAHFSYQQLLELPTDPVALRDRLAKVAIGSETREGTSTAWMMEAINQLLQDPVPTAVRGALYRVIAELPGVGQIADLRDDLGRQGSGLTWTDGLYTYTLVFDRNTGKDLEFRRYAKSAAAFAANAPTALKDGDLMERVTVVSRGVVHSPTATVDSESYVRAGSVTR